MQSTAMEFNLPIRPTNDLAVADAAIDRQLNLRVIAYRLTPNSCPISRFEVRSSRYYETMRNVKRS